MLKYAKYFWKRGSRLLNCSIILDSNVRQTGKNGKKLIRGLKVSDSRLECCWLSCRDFQKSEAREGKKSSSLEKMSQKAVVNCIYEFHNHQVPSFSSNTPLNGQYQQKLKPFNVLLPVGSFVVQVVIQKMRDWTCLPTHPLLLYSADLH